MPGLEGVSVPECLMALLEPRHLDELERALETAPAGAAGAASASRSPAGEGTLGGGVGLWPGEEDADGWGEGGQEEEDDGWRGFSVARVRLLREVLSSTGETKQKKSKKSKRSEISDVSEEAGEGGDEAAAIQAPTKAQVVKLRGFATVLCRLRVASATQTVPELLRVVLEATGMKK